MYFGPMRYLYLSQIKNTLTDSGILQFTATGRNIYPPRFVSILHLAVV
jgi:hypothetical protein